MYRIPTVNAVVVHSVDVVDAPVAAVHRNAAVYKVAIGIPNRGGLLRNDVRAVFFLRLDVIEELGESLGACGEVGIQDAAVHSLSREIHGDLADFRHGGKGVRKVLQYAGEVGFRDVGLKQRREIRRECVRFGLLCLLHQRQQDDFVIAHIAIGPLPKL